MQSDVTELSPERGMNEGLTASFIDPEYDTNQERVHGIHVEFATAKFRVDPDAA